MPTLLAVHFNNRGRSKLTFSPDSFRCIKISLC